MAPAMAIKRDSPALSPRELEICVLVSQAQSNPAIAAELNLAISTVKKHLGRIFLKLDCRTRTELALRYVRGAPVTPAPRQTPKQPAARQGKRK
jgi:DNA-binding NarL/FixJ family response regulator